MKKKNIVLMGLGLAGIAAGLATSIPNAVEAKASDLGTTTYIPFNAENFDVAAGSSWDNPGTGEVETSADDWVDSKNATFWAEARHFNALDDFYRGEKNEPWTGTIRSVSWTQNADTPYVTFTLGGNLEQVSYVQIVDGEGNDATVGGRIYNPYFSDPSISNNMIVRVVEIADAFIGRDIHLEIVDNKSAGWAMINFGALSPNQSLDDVTTTLFRHGFGGQGFNKHPENIANSDIAAQKAIWDHYVDAHNDEYSPFMDEFRNIPDTPVVDDFESGTLSGFWTPDGGYASNADGSYYGDFSIEKAVSSESTLGWVERLPYNKDGDYFLNGWAAAPTEVAMWRLLSRPFVLTGSGLIEAKIGGNSGRVALYEAVGGAKPAADAEALVSSSASDWWDDNMDITAGGRNVTMRRTYIDASAHIGKTVVLALEDSRRPEKWGHGFFDSIDTDVDIADFGFGIDVVSQKQDSWENPRNVAIVDNFVVGGTLSDIASAHAFLTSYYATVRSFKHWHSYCDLAREDVSALATSYDSLSAGAKAVVDRSQDYSYANYVSGVATDYEGEIVLSTVLEGMANVKVLAETGNIASATRNGLLDDGSAIAVGVICIFLFLLAGLGAYILLSKKGRFARKG